MPPIDTRPHVEAFKCWLQAAPCASGRPYQRPTIAGTLGTLRRFFQRVFDEGAMRLIGFGTVQIAQDGVRMNGNQFHFILVTPE